ncbi:MAG: ABC transporter substrate-binding protein [Chloroflexi bacterium]|nr:ABC transporter substrate-binding protein [Chloroflexota bacterium]
MNRKFLAGASNLAVIGLIVAGCASATAPAPTVKSEAPLAKAATPTSLAAPSPTPKVAVDHPKYGGVLRTGQAAEPASFDMHQESGGQHPLYLMPAYSSLLQYDSLASPELKVIPDLATDWQISADGLDYTFRLRSGVKWHDSKPFSSEDVKTSLDRVSKPPRGTRSPRQGTFHAIAEVRAEASDTIRIRLKYPSASLASMLASDWLVILPKHIIEAKGDMKRDIVGTGPFKFKQHIPAASFEYVKNTDYYVKGRPYLDGIMLYSIKDSSTRFAALRTGRVLFLAHPYGVTPSQAKVAKEDPNLVLQSQWRPGLAYLQFNLKRSPWGDPRVRRAVNLTIDRQAVISVAMEGNGLLGAQMPSAGPWGIPVDELIKLPGYRQPKDADIAEAKKLLAEAGFTEGFRTSILTRPEAEHTKRAAVLQSELARVGIKAEHIISESAAFDNTLSRRAFDTDAHSGGTTMDDPDERFGDYYITGGGRNSGDYSNPRFDELYLRQSRALDVNERKRIVREMLNILSEDNPDVALAWSISLIAHSSRVRNYRLAPSTYVNNKHQEVWLAD